MYGMPYVDVDYCKYGMGYRKRTRLWNNVSKWKSQPLCKKDCGSMIGNKHRQTAQQGPCSTHPNNSLIQTELYMIPATLIYEILESIS